MKLPKVLLFATFAFHFSSSRVIYSELSDFNYKFYCSTSKKEFCNTTKKELKSAVLSISSLLDFSPPIKFDAVVDNLSKYINDINKEVPIAALVNTEFIPIDKKFYNLKSPYPNSKKIINKFNSNRNYTEDDFILLLNNFKNDHTYHKNSDIEIKNKAMKEIMKGLLKLGKLEAPYDSLPESGIPESVRDKIPPEVLASYSKRPPSNNVTSFDMRYIHPFIEDRFVCNILERNRNVTLFNGIANVTETSCEKMRNNELSTIFKWKDKLISKGKSTKRIKKLKKQFKRIVAIGDIHGDYEKLISLLRHAKLINKKNKWIAKNTALVQEGDLIDRDKDIIKILDLLQDLREQAPKKGSIVNLILGNHEVGNLQGKYFFTSRDDIKTFGNLEKREEAFSLKGKYGKLLRQDMNVTMIVGDSLFVHAGLYPEYAELGIDQINDHVHNILNTTLTLDEMCEIYNYSTHNPFYFDELLNSEKSPISTRDFASLEESTICPEVEKTLKITNTKRMVIGHTIQHYGEMQTRCNDKLIIIDIGMSSCYGGFFGYLEILNDKNEVWFRYNN